MSLKRFSPLIIISLLVISGCSSLPGLRVLTGQDAGEANVANRTVQELDLVMADKTGATNPSLMATADRIEAASGTIDIVEIRQDAEGDAFTVNMLFNPPAASDTLEGRFAQQDALRRAIELTWQAVIPESVGSDVLRIRLLSPLSINTLDNGQGFVGAVIANADIAREDAATYLSGQRTLDSFFGLIVNGVLNYQTPETMQWYTGTPNHPLFMLTSAQ